LFHRLRGSDGEDHPLFLHNEKRVVWGTHKTYSHQIRHRSKTGLFGVGAEAEDVSVGIGDVHFECPGIATGKHKDFDAVDLEFLVEFEDVFDAEPAPGLTATLVLAAEVDAGAVTLHEGEIVVAPGGVRETELGVELEGDLHVFDAQNGTGSFEKDANGKSGGSVRHVGTMITQWLLGGDRVLRQVASGEKKEKRVVWGTLASEN
jgi:hypothetical protein